MGSNSGRPPGSRRWAGDGNLPLIAQTIVTLLGTKDAVEQLPPGHESLDPRVGVPLWLTEPGHWRGIPAGNNDFQGLLQKLRLTRPVTLADALLRLLPPAVTEAIRLANGARPPDVSHWVALRRARHPYDFATGWHRRWAYRGMGLFLLTGLLFGLTQALGGFANTAPGWMGWAPAATSLYACGFYLFGETRLDLVPWVLLICLLLLSLGAVERWVDLTPAALLLIAPGVLTWLGKRRERLPHNPLRDLLQAVQPAQVG